MSDRDSWTAPASQPARSGVRGALGGSRLFEQPAQRAEVRRFEAFVARDAPVAVEIGFDHGRRLLDHALRWPDTLWVGLEVRKQRVAELASKAPSNLLAWRADARTVFATLMPAARVSRVDILFPTPWWHEATRAKRLLLTPEFVADLRRSLAPSGCVLVATDVGPYFAHVAELFAEWTPVPEPECGDTLSRREWACRRDELRVWRACWSPVC